jgi:hypothetical protein
MASSVIYLSARGVILFFLHLNYAMLIAPVCLIIVFAYGYGGYILFCIYQ